MKYANVILGKFIDRPNRFTAHVEIDGVTETVHVKNTGRLKRLLIPGNTVSLEKSANPNRKTKYDLIAVADPKLGWVNVDSQVPNKVVLEWLKTKDYDFIKPEYVYGDSRIDFYMEKDDTKYLMEVKGCTLEQDDVGYFPDAPTERGVKHLHCLTRAAEAGHRAAVLFVVQMAGITAVRPNDSTHPAFGQALRQAASRGVELWAIGCRVTENSLSPAEPIPVQPDFTQR